MCSTALPLLYQFKAVSLSQQQVRQAGEDVSVSGLSAVVPGWEANRDFISPWFETLKARQAAALKQ